jgi:hypothetical protein
MNTDTMLLVAIAIMLALGLFGMYQWRPVVKFVRDKWIVAAAPEIDKALAKQADERRMLAEHGRQRADSG